MIRVFFRVFSKITRKKTRIKALESKNARK